jgi:death-on-curing protein
MNDLIWLTKDDALEIHHTVIAASGGASGVRDEGLLDSAVARPQNMLVYEGGSIFDCAASYAQSIAQNHPFVDGNKRTAFITADVFLEINGYQLHASQKQQADVMVDLAEKKITRDDLAKFFNDHTTPIEQD